MLQKVILIVFTVFFVVVPVSAQQVFELELREGGNYYFGEGFVNGQILSAFSQTQFRVVPSFNSYSEHQNPNRVQVFVSCNNQTASTSTSSSFRYSSSYSQNTKLYGDLTITATITTPAWADSRTVSVSGSTSFVENSDLSIHTGCYNFNIPSATSREQKQIELSKNLLAKALSELVGQISALNPPLAPAQQVVDFSGDNSPLRQAKVRLSPQAAQKYSQLGYVAVKRGNSIIQYRIIGIEGNVVIVEFSGAPPQKGDVLY